MSDSRVQALVEQRQWARLRAAVQRSLQDANNPAGVERGNTTTLGRLVLVLHHLDLLVAGASESPYAHVFERWLAAGAPGVLGRYLDEG